MKTAGIVLGVFGAWVLYIIVKGNGAVTASTIVPSGAPGDPATMQAVAQLAANNAGNYSSLTGQVAPGNGAMLPHSN